MRIVYLLLLLTLYSNALFAQKEQTYWYSGVRHGMKFENGVRQVLPVHPDSSAGDFSYSNSHHASMSHNQTGAFLFQANGARVLDKNFTVMPNGKTSSTATFTMAVQNIGNTSKYHIIYADKSNLYFAEVDMALRGGLGDVTFFDRVLKTNAIDYFTIVKHQSPGNGYWIITHTIGNNEYEVFNINAGNVIHSPSQKINIGGYAFAPNNMYKQGNMVSNKTGTLIAHSYGSLHVPNSWSVDIIKINKCTGKLEFEKQIPATVTNGNVNQISVAFSKTDKFLYTSTIYMSSMPPLVGIIQEINRYDYNAPDPAATRTPIATIDSLHSIAPRQAALAPDGDIYITSLPMVQPSAFKNYWRVSVISQSETNTPLFKEDAFTPFPVDVHSYHPWFPAFMMDTLQNHPPTIAVEYGCINDSVSFTAKGTSLFDSAYWDLGNGKKNPNFTFNYLYKTPGKYQVEFRWFSCGGSAARQQTIDIGSLPVVNFGPDTTLCSGTKYPLDAERGLNEYQWSTGDTTESIVIEKAGTYWVTVKRGKCQSTDSVKINYLPPIWVELGNEFYLCEDDSQTVKLDAGKGFTTYLWTPTNDTIQWIEVRKSGPYYVVVKDFRGCSGEDGTVVQRKCDVEFEMPNAFTPNGDGINDVFAPYITDAVKYELSIYNRWGELLFHTNDQQNGWDGNYHQLAAQTGVYVYTLSYSGYQNKILRKYNKTGTFHLLR
jgi:gliding motility-associated-like protein